MPAVVIRPAAVGTYDAWALAAGATKVAATDPGDALAHDDATSYISSATVAAKQAFTVLCTGSPVIGTINSVSGNVRDQPNTGVSTIGFFVRVGGADGVEQTWTHPGADNSWANRGFCPNPLKSGSVALQGTDFKWSDTNFQMVVRYVNTGATTVFITSIWMALDYTPPSGGWMDLVASFGILALLGGALALSEMPKLAREVALRSHGDIRIQAHEYPALLRELREGRRTRHFLLGVG